MLVSSNTIWYTFDKMFERNINMVLDNIECGKFTVDKFFDVRYGSEKYFEYIGREAYRALQKLLNVLMLFLKRLRNTGRGYLSELSAPMMCTVMRISRLEKRQRLCAVNSYGIWSFMISILSRMRMRM